MFVWHHHSALITVHLADVPPSSKSGALAKSEWITRGWTVGEFLALNPYLDYHSPNRTESLAIIQELQGATDIDQREALVAFCPEMTRARKKLQWASTRVTTSQEDIAYSLFDTFRVGHLPVIHGEMKQNAIGRLLREKLAQLGNITVLDDSLGRKIIRVQ